MGDRTKHVDRCMQILGNRRCRFCLYHLYREAQPLSIRDLAVLVESSISPPDTTLSEWQREEAILQLIHTTLPKLQSAGLLRVTDDCVRLASDSVLPIHTLLSTTAEFELEHEELLVFGVDSETPQDQTFEGLITRAEQYDRRSYLANSSP